MQNYTLISNNANFETDFLYFFAERVKESFLRFVIRVVRCARPSGFTETSLGATSYCYLALYPVLLLRILFPGESVGHSVKIC